jgi:Leucine-rich repeat (LRR) protein
MKLIASTLASIILGVLFMSSCKKSKSSIRQEPGSEKISIVKAADDNTDWQLLVDASSSDRANVWVDKNSNGIKDIGEAIAGFGIKVTVPFSGNRTLDVYGKLVEFGCSSNELITIDLSKSVSLKVLDCAFNRLTALNLSSNTSLESLDCSYNELPTLNLNQNTALTDLSCSYNKLTSLNVSQNSKLISIHALKNSFPTVDVSKNLVLERLTISNGVVTTLNLSTNTALQEVQIHRNIINSSNMQQLISSLPARPATNKGKLYVFYTPDGNSLPNAASVSNARSKNWILYQFGTSWQEIP